MSDNGDLEERHAALLSAALFPRWMTVLVVLFLTLVTAALTLMYVQLWPLVNDTKSLAHDTNTAVNETIGQRDETIADQQIVIGQAVTYITDMARQIEALGGDPPEVILDPDKEN